MTEDIQARRGPARRGRHAGFITSARARTRTSLENWNREFFNVRRDILARARRIGFSCLIMRRHTNGYPSPRPSPFTVSFLLASRITSNYKMPFDYHYRWYASIKMCFIVIIILIHIISWIIILMWLLLKFIWFRLLRKTWKCRREGLRRPQINVWCNIFLGQFYSFSFATRFEQIFIPPVHCCCAFREYRLFARPSNDTWGN